ncbi:MAG: phosphatase PAP2 family protein [Brachymonas denitrificans]|uniref:phosphatase PAP2 family protein n=1 Tax=Brachymonas denitrificans TaxID=28220 RepID=UPI00352DE2DB
MAQPPVPPATGPAPIASWQRQIGQRVTTLCWLKALGTTAFMWVFFLFYFELLHHPRYPITVMPDTWIDRAVTFSPDWVIIYFSLWVYVSLPGALQRDLRGLLWHGASALLMCAAGLAFYYWYPTTFMQPRVDWSSQPLGQILQSVDAPGNAFPSMHVAYALFAWAWIRHELHEVRAPRWLHILSLLWCMAIGFSTLATKQHVWWDVLAGIVLGLSAGSIAVLATRWRKGLPLRKPITSPLEP